MCLALWFCITPIGKASFKKISRKNEVLSSQMKEVLWSFKIEILNKIQWISKSENATLQYKISLWFIANLQQANRALTLFLL